MRTVRKNLPGAIHNAISNGGANHVIDENYLQRRNDRVYEMQDSVHLRENVQEGFRNDARQRKCYQTLSEVQTDRNL